MKTGEFLIELIEKKGSDPHLAVLEILEKVKDLEKRGGYSLLETLFLVGRIKLMDGKGTASIALNKKLEIRFYKDFFQKNIETPEDFAYIFLHELLHYELGDLVVPRERKHLLILNLAQDVLVNARIFLDFLETPDFVRKISQPEKDPVHALTLPPDVLDPENPTPRWTVAKERVFSQGIKRLRKDPTKWLPVFKSLYTRVYQRKASLSEVYKKIARFYGVEPRVIVEIPVNTRNLPDELTDKLGELSRVPGIGGPLIKKKIKKSEIKKEKIRIISSKIRKAIERNKMETHVGYLEKRTRGVFPVYGRRELFLLSMGYVPIFYPRKMHTLGQKDGKLNVFLDVSGSMNHVLPVLYEILLNLKDLWGKNLWGFSTEVVTLTLSDLKRGILETTGGTSYDCIINKAAELDMKKILVVSDGFARISSQSKKIIKERAIEFYLLWVTHGLFLEREPPNANEGFIKEWWLLDTTEF